MERLQTWRTRAIASLCVAAVSAGAALLPLVLEIPLGDYLARASYDSLHSLGPRVELLNSPVIIAYLDRASYQMIGGDPLRRWPRALHAKLLERLRDAGAKAVVFDIIFDSPSEDARGDEKFAAALEENGRVILAAEHNEKVTHRTGEDQAWTRTTSFRPPYKSFARAAAGWGVATLSIDDDLEVRRFLAGFPESGRPSLAWATCEFSGAALTRGSMESANDHWIRYYGPALAIPHVSLSEVLRSARRAE